MFQWLVIKVYHNKHLKLLSRFVIRRPWYHLHGSLLLMYNIRQPYIISTCSSNPWLDTRNVGYKNTWGYILVSKPHFSVVNDEGIFIPSIFNITLSVCNKTSSKLLDIFMTALSSCIIFTRLPYIIVVQMHSRSDGTSLRWIWSIFLYWNLIFPGNDKGLEQSICSIYFRTLSSNLRFYWKPIYFWAPLQSGELLHNLVYNNVAL